MAINETEKRQKLARQLSQLGGSFMDVLYAMDAVRRQAASGALVFVDADFTGVSGLAHLDKARIDAGLLAVTTITTALVNANLDDTLEALRG